MLAAAVVVGPEADLAVADFAADLAVAGFAGDMAGFAADMADTDFAAATALDSEADLAAITDIHGVMVIRGDTDMQATDLIPITVTACLTTLILVEDIIPTSAVSALMLGSELTDS